MNAIPQLSDDLAVASVSRLARTAWKAAVRKRFVREHPDVVSEWDVDTKPATGTSIMVAALCAYRGSAPADTMQAVRTALKESATSPSEENRLVELVACAVLDIDRGAKLSCQYLPLDKMHMGEGDLLVHWCGGGAITAIEVKHINRTNPTQKRKKVREQALYYASVAKFKQRHDHSSVSALAVTNEAVNVVVQDMDYGVALAVVAKHWKKHVGKYAYIAREITNGTYGDANMAREANGDVNKPASLLDKRVQSLVRSISLMLPCGQYWIHHTSTKPCESSCHW